MREIKFRCYNNAAKIMYPAVHFALRLDGLELQLMPGCEHYEKPYIPNPGNMTYMQYTGLLDKSAKEIYEGDIVNDGDRLGEVRFNHGSFVIAYKEISNVKYLGNKDNCEIVGNLYEDKELLK